MTQTNLPAVPFIGQTFRPDTTDSIGVILGVSEKRTRRGVEHTVTYNYQHAPETTYSRPYAEVRSMAWAL